MVNNFSELIKDESSDDLVSENNFFFNPHLHITEKLYSTSSTKIKFYRLVREKR